MRIELGKLVLVSTRITYQATGDAGFCMYYIILRFGIPVVLTCTATAAKISVD